MAAKDWRFSRQTLLNACLIQESIGHASFDRLILELGIESVTTSQSGSGMKARANSLATFVLKNPDLVLDNGVTLAVAIVQQALQTDPRRDQVPSGVKDSVHQGFWKGLVTDGYSIYQGQLARVTLKAKNGEPSEELHEHDEDTERNYSSGRNKSTVPDQEKWSPKLTDPFPFPPLARVGAREPGEACQAAHANFRRAWS